MNNQVRENATIVAVGYNRVGPLARLLAHLRAAHYAAGTRLVISLDHSGESGPAELAAAFEWPHGEKRVIRHERRLGLREHILSCGDLTREYGAIVLFEDDIVPSPHFCAYVDAALARYENDDRIAGIGLYSYRINEFNNLDFEPLDDGRDGYFLQVAASWGQAWNARQWSAFRRWYACHRGEAFRVSDGIPRQLESWRDNSWKRHYIRYLVATGRYFAYPRASLSTNMATPGTNTRRPVSIYQVPLDLQPRDWDLPSLDASLARYDVFYEPEAACLTAYNPALGQPDFDVDLMGIKPREVLRRRRLLSARVCRHGLGFSLLGQGPPASAIVQGRAGRFFHLSQREDFGRMSLLRRLALARACQAGAPLNTLMFQALKPVQTELTIARRRHGAKSDLRLARA